MAKGFYVGRNGLRCAQAERLEGDYCYINGKEYLIEHSYTDSVYYVTDENEQTHVLDFDLV